MATNPEWATQFSVHELVEKTGTQGVELLMWLAMRGALSAAAPGVRRVHGNYHIPISNTATALLALEAVTVKYKGRRHARRPCALRSRADRVYPALPLNGGGRGRRARGGARFPRAWPRALR